MKKIRKCIGNFLVGTSLISLLVGLYPSGGFDSSTYARFLLSHPETGAYLQLQSELEREKNKEKIYERIELTGKNLEKDIQLIEDFKQSLTAKNYYSKERIIEDKIKNLRDIYPNIEKSVQEVKDIRSMGVKCTIYGLIGFLLSGIGGAYLLSEEKR